MYPPPEINRLTVKNRIIVKMIMRPSFSWMRVPRGSSQRGKSSSNPTAFTDFARYHSARCKTPVFWQPCATGKTTRFSPHDAMHRVAWALQSSKAIGQICEKPWENHVSRKWRVERSCGQDRNRTFGCFPCVFGEFERYSDKIPRDRNSVQLTIKQRLSERWR